MNDRHITGAMLILNHYGAEAQKSKLCEELQELIDAAKDDLHYETPETRKHFIEELADVTIMVEQARLALTLEEKAEYYKVIEYKINRQLRRMRNGD